MKLLYLKKGIDNTFYSGLPTTNTDCIGRLCELETAQRLLKTARLLTLTGTGRVGKTRLALQIAATMEEHFSAVRFVTLSAIFDARQLISSLAVALQVSEVAHNSYEITSRGFHQFGRVREWENDWAFGMSCHLLDNSLGKGSWRG